MLLQGEFVNMSLPPLIQLIYGPARDLQIGKHCDPHNENTFELFIFHYIIYVPLCYFYLSPKGSSFSTGTKLLCSSSARILLWGSVSSFGLKTLFPAYTKQIKSNLKYHKYHRTWTENEVYLDIKTAMAPIKPSPAAFPLYIDLKQYTFCTLTRVKYAPSLHI